MPEPRIYNFDLPSHKTAAINYLLSLTGVHELATKPRLKGKTLEQLGYLFGVVYPTIADAATEMWGETVTIDDIHFELKRQFLSRPVVDRNTGEELISRTASLRKLNVKELSEYIEKCIKLSNEYFHTPVEPPDQFHNKRGKK